MQTRNMQRRPAQQLWAVGETVKVGFLSLRITGRTGHGWRLVNRDGARHYEFDPHRGLFAVESGATQCMVDARTAISKATGSAA